MDKITDKEDIDSNVIIGKDNFEVKDEAHLIIIDM
jgi:hypothetical protein